MFRIKICGITSVADGVAAVAAGADAIGLNFYQRSRRNVSLEAGAEIAAALPPQATPVGVFVNHSVAEIQAIALRVGLNWVQLHGDEPDSWIEALAPLRVIRAVRISRQADSHQIDALAARCNASRPKAVLIDALDPAEYGGTGQVTDWIAAAELQSRLRMPMILAGGLRPENVLQAILEVRPAAVDVASGVESSPGVKHAAQVKAFVAAAARGWERPWD